MLLRGGRGSYPDDPDDAPWPRSVRMPRHGDPFPLEVGFTGSRVIDVAHARPNQGLSEQQPSTSTPEYRKAFRCGAPTDEYRRDGLQGSHQIFPCAFRVRELSGSHAHGLVINTEMHVASKKWLNLVIRFVRFVETA